MTELIKARLKEWGNSLGVIVPREIVLERKLKPNQEVFIEITKKDNLDDFFGKSKIKNDAQKIKNESRKLWKMN